MIGKKSGRRLMMGKKSGRRLMMGKKSGRRLMMGKKSGRRLMMGKNSRRHWRFAGCRVGGPSISGAQRASDKFKIFPLAYSAS
jgi:hypothetical protein